MRQPALRGRDVVGRGPLITWGGQQIAICSECWGRLYAELICGNPYCRYPDTGGMWVKRVKWSDQTIAICRECISLLDPAWGGGRAVAYCDWCLAWLDPNPDPDPDIR